MAKLVGDRHFSILTDSLGTPVLMVDDGGARVWSASMSIYGTLRDFEGEPHACPFRWPGQYEDAETGLYYNRHRYYDPEAGQYTSQDPIGMSGGTALYGYVFDPLRYADPLGLRSKRAAAVRISPDTAKITSSIVIITVLVNLRRRNFLLIGQMTKS